MGLAPFDTFAFPPSAIGRLFDSLSPECRARKKRPITSLYDTSRLMRPNGVTSNLSEVSKTDFGSASRLTEGTRRQSESRFDGDPAAVLHLH